MFSAGLFALTCARPHSQKPTHSPSVRTVASLAPGTILESLAVRPNSDILTTYTGEEIGVYTIRKPGDGKAQLELIAPLPGVETLWGISHVITNDDFETYVVLGGNLTSTTTYTALPGSWKAWKIAFPKHGCDDPKTSLITNFLPNTTVLNGLGSIPGSPGSVLIADSGAGAVGRLDITTGHWEPHALKYPEMAVPTNSSFDLGVGSVKIFGYHAYFSNAAAGIMYRVSVDAHGRPLQDAKVQRITDLAPFASTFDDFVFDNDGNIYVSTNAPWNTIAYIDMSKNTPKVSKVVGGTKDLEVAGCSSLAFGQGVHDKDVLYVTLDGDKTISTDARVVALQV